MKQAITILDGGTGRELKRIGAPFRQPEWSALALIKAPEYVAQAHRNFIEAGADIITTNSYAVVPFHIGEERFASDGRRLIEIAGQLARQAADAAPHPVRVAGSLPPVFGSYRADLFDAGRVQDILSVLVQGLRPYIDHWQAETLSSIAEAQAVRTAIGNDGKPLWISFTLDDEDANPATPRLRSGETVADAVRAVAALGAAAILFNCSQPEVMAAAVATARQTLAEIGADLQIGVYANAFPPQRKDAEANADLDEIRADLTAPGYLKFAQDWVACGASIVGGCCGIGPEHIAALKAAFRP
ncbi:Homocysteine/selenocysteine methylase (S-methylmethionine-dependent) [Formivibrio citricus]|uniref:Homocysteine/selenocysteine methylase (S-methylmethionine-dependent) n=1 Tax=Formivibrio citricus TaxID=83765 RepID=A0A1I4VCI4_9NEIS|nr:homocysteine S-methyltransferase family protein [Formivibrio citricus]SFM98878.1 Homocysteine/selenocysteine methylase (S-methylmethionine-dependent) [Formivibrio citricus]